MKSLPTFLLGSLLVVTMISCGGDNHPGAPLAAPSIALQPASQTVYSGGTAAFSIGVTGNPAPDIVWQRSNDNGTTWSTINGAASTSYSFTVGPVDRGAKFRALATNSQGSILSEEVTLREVPAVYAGGVIDVTNPESGYWLNGTWVPLPSPAGTTARVTALSVSGSKVLAAGSWTSAGLQIPTGYWLDGTWFDLALPSGSTWGSVNSLVLSGNDLYLAGELYPGYSPGYWLNGTWNGLPIPPGSDLGAELFAFAVSGTDVYAGGYKVSNGIASPGYWLNGTWADLPVPSGSVGGTVGSIVVSGNDVYAAGYAGIPNGAAYGGNPGYWLNGSWVGLALPHGQTAGAVASLVVSGTDVYAAGFAQNASARIPGYWLNGTWVGLAIPPGADGGVITSLVLSGGKVYAGGYSTVPPGPPFFSSSSYSPGYWVNGAWVALPNPPPGTGYSIVSSLSVIP